MVSFYNCCVLQRILVIFKRKLKIEKKKWKPASQKWECMVSGALTEPRYEKPGFLPMRKQRRRSASQS